MNIVHEDVPKNSQKLFGVVYSNFTAFWACSLVYIWLNKQENPRKLDI